MKGRIIHIENSDAPTAWLSTAGGPFVFLPPSLLPIWKGVLSAGESHYALACATNDYVGVGRLAEADFLILNDEPLGTQILGYGTGIVAIARTVFSSSNFRFPSSMDLGALPSVQAPLAFRSVSRLLVGIDAAEPADDIRGDSITIAIELGDHALRVSLYQPNGSNKFLICWADKLGQPEGSPGHRV